MSERRSGMSVVLFSFIWLAVTVGTVLIMLNSSGSILPPGREANAGNQETSRGETPLLDEVDKRKDWGKVPYAYEDEGKYIEGEHNPNEGNDFDLPDEALEPIKNLCLFLMNGGSANLKKVLPPEYVDTLLNKFELLTSVLGGEDAVIESVLKLKFGSIIEKSGAINGIDYEVQKGKRLEGKEFDEMMDKLIESGVECDVDDAYRIKIRLFIDGDKEMVKNDYTFSVFKTNGKWYISPDGLSI